MGVVADSLLEQLAQRDGLTVTALYSTYDTNGHKHSRPFWSVNLAHGKIVATGESKVLLAAIMAAADAMSAKLVVYSKLRDDLESVLDTHRKMTNVVFHE